MKRNDYYKAYDIRYKQVHEKGELWEVTEHTPEVEKFLLEYRVNKKSKILDVGCGEGRDAIYLLNKGYNLLAIDYSNEAIVQCNKISNNKYLSSFRTFDIFKEKLNQKYDYIYSVSVLHMFLIDEHRKHFLEFIGEHLKKNGKAFITSLGNGIENKKTNIDEAYRIVTRTIQSSGNKVDIVNTSCCIVDWDKLTNEIESSGLIVEKKWISKDMPGFNNSMCVVVKRKE